MRALRAMRFLVTGTEKKPRRHIRERGLRPFCGGIQNWTERIVQADGAEIPATKVDGRPICGECLKAARAAGWVK